MKKNNNMTRTCSARWLPLLKQLEDGLLLITASNRQADFIGQQYRYYQESKNANPSVWLRPAIITDKQWLSSLYQQLMIHHGDSLNAWSLLSDQESRVIWEQVIESDDDYLLDTRRTAERVRQAASRLEQWLLTDKISEDESFTWREETKRFKHWQGLVDKKFKTNNWLEAYQLDNWLSDKIQLLVNHKSSALLPRKIGLLGFQQITPAKEQLFSSLRSSGIKLDFLSPKSISTEIYRLELSDNLEEIKQAACWAKQHWLNDPSLKIGVVLPNLNNNREQTRIIFERQFAANEIVKNDDQMLRPFDISLGLPLSAYSVVDSALMLMSLTSKPLDQEEAIQLLLSPFLNGTNKQTQLISLTALLRKSRQPKFTMNDLLYFCSKTETEAPKKDNHEDKSLSRFFETISAFDTKNNLPPSQWALKFSALLEDLKWCEHRKLSSTEYQTKESWNKKIDQISIYDHLSGSVSWSRFQSMFKRLIHETLFQPQTGDCPIQIMGVLEAAFLTFDKIRVCGIDNRLWPESAQPSPFIPYDLQRQYDMPNATAERELTVSKQLLGLLSNAADEVIFSHAKGNGEESLSVSPLLESIELRSLDSQPLYFSPAKAINAQSKEIELLTDDSAPAINASLVRGGSKLLQDIARCQFRAFAHHRLQAKAAEDPREGLDPLDRGNLVHRILEHCWRHLFDMKQSTLQQLFEEGQLEESIIPFIDRAITELQAERHAPLSEAIINLEKRRLSKLILKWLEMERKRPYFEVKEVEQSVEASIAKTSIRLQLDRVDELEDGSLAIIDYKTGNVERKNWFGERPDEPQLPLYAMVLTEQQQTIGALLYGQVKSSECRFQGVADDRSLVSGITKDFEKDNLNTEEYTLAGQVIQWQHNLEGLMDEYLAGESAVTPRDDNVCRYCDLHGFCRIGEMSQRETGS
ncbi:MAG: ATP-dependent helicase/nuclease subunit B [Enterobacterales bacterium]|jgi:ATP-dependent helicase/nuclease subunit B